MPWILNSCLPVRWRASLCEQVQKSLKRHRDEIMRHGCDPFSPLQLLEFYELAE